MVHIPPIRFAVDHFRFFVQPIFYYVSSLYRRQPRKQHSQFIEEEICNCARWAPVEHGRRKHFSNPKMPISTTTCRLVFPPTYYTIEKRKNNNWKWSYSFVFTSRWSHDGWCECSILCDATNNWQPSHDASSCAPLFAPDSGHRRQ